ncbi:MAG: EI24 domain-containing protein [Pseudomonadota bacterium]
MTIAPSRLSQGLAGDLRRAVAQALDRRFLGVLLRALGLTVGLLVVLAAILGTLAGFIPASIDLPLIGAVPTPVGLFQSVAVIGTLLASAFLMIPVSAAFVALFVDRVVVAVDTRHYPDRRGAATRRVVEQIGEAARTAFLVVVINIVALVLLLLTGPLAPFLFYALNGYILGRETFETVAAHYMSAREARALRKRHGLTVWLGGTMMAIPLTIPIMNLLIPVLGTAAFTHTVQRLRAREA